MPARRAGTPAKRTTATRTTARRRAAPAGERSVAAAERTLAILDAFLAGEGPLMLKDIEERTGLFRSVILRYLLSLERLNYVHRRADGLYQLGSRAYQLGKSYERGFRLAEFVHPVLARLVERTGETASFYVREGDSRLCLFRKNSPQALRVSVNEGRLVPLDRASTDAVLRDFAEGIGPEAANPDSLLRASSGVIDAWTASLSTPVVGAGDVLCGALTLSGPTQRFDTGNAGIRRLLRDEGLALSAALGFTPAGPRR